MSENFIDREKLNRIWDSVGPGSISYLNSTFKSETSKFIQFLIQKLLTQDSIEIGTFSQGNESGSIIPYDSLNPEKQLNLILNNHDILRLDLEVRDDDGLLHEYSHELDSQQIKLIPTVLIQELNNVLKAGESKTILPGSLEGTTDR